MDKPQAQTASGPNCSKNFLSSLELTQSMAIGPFMLYVQHTELEPSNRAILTTIRFKIMWLSCCRFFEIFKRLNPDPRPVAETSSPKLYACSPRNSPSPAHFELFSFLEPKKTLSDPIFSRMPFARETARFH
ncbi:hypothetical protein EVAR_59669_1 [Eumeta japonica]|uniref:Uncharacterized protein n=1 Tax=Eumeta variegata TaxID=151549 RepID=A0A4C1Z2H8_EUMVA|nr:hypothetical protein EVAR_59669_1 [Eumeta japonica]